MDNMTQTAPYGVYVLTDERGVIRDINSDAFLPDTDMREGFCPTETEDSAQALPQVEPSPQCGVAPTGQRLRSEAEVATRDAASAVGRAKYWTRIDEGYGDRYHHAQGNYLDGPLLDERGIPRYKLADGEAVERTQEEIDADYTPPTPMLTAEQRMDEIEAAMMELAAMMTTDTPGGDA